MLFRNAPASAPPTKQVQVPRPPKNSEDPKTSKNPKPQKNQKNEKEENPSKKLKEKKSPHLVVDELADRLDAVHLWYKSQLFQDHLTTSEKSSAHSIIRRPSKNTKNAELDENGNILKNVV